MGVENQQPIISVKESESILEKLSLKSSQGGYKVMLVWLPELMNEPTANKLLKILEEPPAETAFLLVSDEPERLLPTILSRTQRVEFRPFSEQELMDAVNHTVVDVELDDNYSTKQKLKIYAVLTSLSNCSEKERKKYAKKVKKLL